MKNSNFRFCVLGGGSKGNSIFIEGKGTRILVDAGLSCKQLELRLGLIGVEPASIDALVITHEHSDHTRGIRVFAKKHGVPAYLNSAALGALESEMKGEVQTKLFESSGEFTINDLRLSPFSIPHDARDPVGLVIALNGKRLGIASDLGYVTRLVRERLKGVNSLVLESNHDMEMLFNGPYPWTLKQRIKGKQGHLSNEESRTLLEDIFSSSDLKCVILTHLSETNNCRDLLASSTGAFLKGKGISFDIASQLSVTKVLEVFPEGHF